MLFLKILIPLFFQKIMITQNEVLFVLLQELERRSSYGGPINTFINTSFEVKNDPNAQVLKWTEKIKKNRVRCKSGYWNLKSKLFFD